MIYQEKVLRMIQAIINKKEDVILDRNTYIPSLGSNYTRQEFRDWLQIRKNILISARDDGETAFNASFNNWYSNLGVQAQAVVDDILIGEPLPLDITEQQWETVVPALIYYYITNP